MIANRLNETLAKEQICSGKICKFVALPHTEGCGSVGADCELMYNRTMIGTTAENLAMDKSLTM